MPNSAKSPQSNGHRLWIPEWPHLSPTLREVFSLPPIDPTGSELQALYQAIRALLGAFLGTSQTMIMVNGNPPAIREALINNLVHDKVLHFVTGEDSELWHRSSEAIGKQALKIKIPTGQAITASGATALMGQAPQVDAVALMHSEASTGIMNPIRELAPILRQNTEQLLVVDATYSAFTTELSFDRDHIDAMVIGSVAFGLPPGFCMVVLSYRAMERIESVENRGYAFDFKRLASEFAPSWQDCGPSLPAIFALATQLQAIKKEGLAERISRHWRLAAKARAFAREAFEVVAAEGYGAYGLTVVKTQPDFDLERLHKFLKSRGAVIGRGRGEFSDCSFRISHTHETSFIELEELLDAIAEEVSTWNK
ncbi:MAG: aminotransferase class V-fold PLP-dependent enzyme [Planctomycetota bacterium]|nr:aminotransferase class V-fold PLP-dependent enzyme [Planctomycetota bacterium]